MGNCLIEVCAAHYQSAFAAQVGGAKRVELCDNLYEGGTTPSIGLIKYTRTHLSINLMVMIRPRGSDFCYTDDEFEIMKEDIRICKQLGVHGVVFGILLPDGNVDIDRTGLLVELAKPMNITFHRAFDMTPDPFKAMEDIIRLKIDRILTAGQKNKAPDGIELIAELVKSANKRITIMPGSGIHEKNIRKIRDISGAVEFHLTGKKIVESKMQFRKTDIYMGGFKEIPEYFINQTDSDRIREIVNTVNQL